MIQATPERSRGAWRAGEAIVWRCQNSRCGKVLALVAGDTFLIRHMKREIEVTGASALSQVCDDCGETNKYPIGRDYPL
jgi:RNase P subunit RPR2